MKISLTNKLLAVNLGVIAALTCAFLALGHLSNQTLLSRAMNGIDAKAMELLSGRLAAHYLEEGSFDTLVSDPSRWSDMVNDAFFTVFFSVSPQNGVPPSSTGGQMPEPTAPSTKQKPCDPPFGTFLQRLSLLDANRKPLIAPEIQKSDVHYRDITVSGQTLGWLQTGKINVDIIPLAEHFFDQQLKLTTWASVAGAIVAATLSILLSRQITSPVKRLTDGAKQLAARNFEFRVQVDTKDELQDLAESFNAIARDLSRFEAQQKQWLMDISHEFRTPLTILIGEVSEACESIAEGDHTPIHSIQEEVMRIKRLVDDLHDLSTFDRIGFNLNLERIHLDQLVDEQLRQYDKAFADRTLRLRCEVPDRPQAIIGDADRLAQVVRNIFDNCLRYTESPGEVWITCGTGAGFVYLNIDDSGPGASQETIDQLFDRLYRADASRNSVSGGRGLGLAICKAIVTSHGGSITAKQNSRGGLGFHIRLPEAGPTS